MTLGILISLGPVTTQGFLITLGPVTNLGILKTVGLVTTLAILMTLGLDMTLGPTKPQLLGLLSSMCMHSTSVMKGKSVQLPVHLQIKTYFFKF